MFALVQTGCYEHLQISQTGEVLNSIIIQDEMCQSEGHALHWLLSFAIKTRT